MIDGEPCRVVGISPSSKGRGRARVDAIGIFDDQKRSIVLPTSAEVGVPVIERGGAQVLAVVANSAQLMDLATYEIFSLPIPMALRGDVREDAVVEYVQASGRRKIELVRG